MQQRRQTPVQAAWSELDCYGCGPANPDGLQLESYPTEDGHLVATFEPDDSYTSGAENVAYGGLVASLIDCHSVWTAITAAHRQAGIPPEEQAVEYVTSELSIDFHRPTPLDEPLHLDAWVDGDVGRETPVVCEVGTDDATTARGEALAYEVSGHY